jgi:cellulose synthase (UDP-forming)
MNAGGWKGVHALDAEAHGDGPHSFADCMTQEFQWSRSLMTLLLTMTPKCRRKLPTRILCQFLFTQLWYLIFSGVMLLSFALPLIAIGTRTPWVQISYLHFLAGALLVNASLIAMTYWLRRTGCLRPARPKLISWEIFVFQFARWPWVICGITAGVCGAIRRHTWQFRVTPKDSPQSELAFCLILPPAILVLISSLVTLMCEAGDATGYYFFSILNGFAYTAVLAVMIKKHEDENQDPATSESRSRYGILCWGIVAGAAALTTLGLWWRGSDALGRILATPPHSREVAATGHMPGPSDHLSVFRWGVYDPDQLLQAREGFSLEHVFVSWAALDPEWLAEQLASIEQRNRIPLITVEPWADATQEATTGTLFDDILAGEYDPILETFAETVRDSGTHVFVRWGHEMENLIGRYPWITRDHALFIKVYRHVVDELRSRADNIVFVWSPAGNRECPAYWPGDEYVDVVGLSILCFPDWERRQYGRTRSFEEMFSEKYDRVSRFGHPVMIAEFGVAGSNGHQLAWLREAFAGLSDYPLLKSIVFYFSRDIDGAWGQDLATPDWRFRLTTLDEAKQALPEPG